MLSLYSLYSHVSANGSDGAVARQIPDEHVHREDYDHRIRKAERSQVRPVTRASGVGAARVIIYTTNKTSVRANLRPAHKKQREHPPRLWNMLLRRAPRRSATGFRVFFIETFFRLSLSLSLSLSGANTFNYYYPRAKENKNARCTIASLQFRDSQFPRWRS